MIASLIKISIVFILIIGCVFYYFHSWKKSKFVDLLWKKGKFLDLEHLEAPFKYTVIKYEDKLYDTAGNRIYPFSKAGRPKLKIVS